MTVRRVVLSALGGTLLCTFTCLAQAQPDWRMSNGPVRVYNTAKQKLRDGKQIVGVTISSPDPNIYCAAANSGFDYTWIEMQHSPLTYSDVAKMIYACRGASAVPFIRVPDATESDIQKATDIGAIGIIVPTVDTVEKAQNAVKWSRYPPLGRRSMGSGQYGELWGKDYRQTINDNMLVMVMIETPLGVANAKEIAAVPGIDVIFAASTDLGNFSGTKQGEPRYEEMVKTIHDTVLAAGIKLGGPLAWKDRPGFTFFQGPGETALIRSGAPVVLKTGAPGPTTERKKGVAPLEGVGPQ
jgi:2-keto-3-deoxy-L-rhamnonate aldolase RhmA